MAERAEMMELPCDICSRILDRSRRRPVCASCAQATLYEPRLSQVAALLDRDNAHARAEAMVRPGNDGILAALPPDADFDAITAGINKCSVQRARDERNVFESRIAAITDRATELRKQIAAHREFIAAQKKQLDTRREKLRTALDDFHRHQPSVVDPVRSVSKKISQRLERNRQKLVDARLVLCREAALACNFSRHKRPDGRSDYILGAIAIPNLKELNVRTQSLSKRRGSSSRTIAEPHELVSEALENTARLVSLCAHYLQVRLPAEIILPHEGFPRAVVMPKRASYKIKEPAYPGSLSLSQTSSPTASRVLDRHRQTRPRPLHLDRPLAQLSKEDSKSYGFFVEGVALLAWDVAWLCKTQGLDNVNSFDDFCSIGRNLWHLLVNQFRRQPRPEVSRRTSTVSGRGEDGQDDATMIQLGIFSHASTQHNLYSVEGAELLQGWRLDKVAQLTVKLKSVLLSEILGADWDLLEEREWADTGGGDENTTILVNGLRITQTGQVAAVQDAAAQDGGDTDSTAEARRKSGSGWMKVRGRSAET